jgi:hypothetical protein
VAFLSRRGLPAALQAAVGVGPGERVQAWAACAGAPGDVVVATDLAVYLPRAEGYERVPWDLVQRAAWADGVLDLRTRPGPGAKLRRTVLRLDDVRDLPEVVQARVTASVVVQQHLDLDDVDGGVVVAARRVSGSDELRWSVRFDPGTDGSDPTVKAAAGRALDDLRGSLGL